MVKTNVFLKKGVKLPHFPPNPFYTTCAQFFPNWQIRIRGENDRALRIFEIAQLTIFGCAIKNRFKALNGTTNHFKTKQGGSGLYAHATIKQFVPAHFFAEHTQQPTMAQKKKNISATQSELKKISFYHFLFPNHSSYLRSISSWHWKFFFRGQFGAACDFHRKFFFEFVFMF